MSEEFFSYVMLALAGLAIFAVGWGLIGIVRSRRSEPTSASPQEPTRLGEILRAENDRVKLFLEQHSKTLKHEFGETIDTLKDANTRALSELQQQLGGRIDGIGSDLDARMKALD